MQIVIDIPEEVKEAFDKGDINFCFYDYNSVIGRAIRNGTPLPKGHGRLIDADALIDILGCSDRDIYCKAIITEDAPTIIEADKDSE